jgi:hypothetical protein
MPPLNAGAQSAPPAPKKKKMKKISKKKLRQREKVGRRARSAAMAAEVQIDDAVLLQRLERLRSALVVSVAHISRARF